LKIKNYHFYVLTGEIKTGKSTSLLNWANRLKSIGGIIQLQENEKRFIFDITSKQKKELTKKESENAIPVGKFFFDKNVLEWGNELLLRALNENVNWLIFDEYGISEFENQCFEPNISELFYVITKRNLHMNCVIVVREKLLKQFISKFGETLNPTIIQSVEELQLED